jgi:hypothetical protein
MQAPWLVFPFTVAGREQIRMYQVAVRSGNPTLTRWSGLRNALAVLALLVGMPRRDISPSRFSPIWPVFFQVSFAVSPPSRD